MARAQKAPRLHIVVTAGPTREYIDPVRYMSNESSGLMGFSIADAAARAGHRVTLVAGPVSLDTPRGVTRVDVVSARDMLRAVRSAFATADALYMAAAVADWRPARKLAGKWRLKDTGAESTNLQLVRNPDILATVARRKAKRLVVGFALETGAGVSRAKVKLKKKNADFVVLNSTSALNAARTTVTIIGTDGKARTMRNRTKGAVARALVGLLAEVTRQPA